jgi:hypothetical protein
MWWQPVMPPTWREPVSIGMNCIASCTTAFASIKLLATERLLAIMRQNRSCLPLIEKFMGQQFSLLGPSCNAAHIRLAVKNASVMRLAIIKMAH